MRSDLDHLPQRKRRALERSVTILCEEFAETLKGKLSDKRKKGQILKIILFGSHARGDWVEDRSSGYFSDYDLLVVVDTEEFTDFEYWERAQARLLQEEFTLASSMRAGTQFIVHSLGDVNDQLSRGRYFFMDIVREGIALYEAPGHPFATPQPLSSEVAHEEAQAYFDEYFPSAEWRFDVAKRAMAHERLKEAAFDLHQTVERLYHCTLLTLTLYTPKLHDIKTLRSRCEDLDARLITAWPRNTRFSRRSFQRLRRAYVEARYSLHYAITEEELSWLVERIAVLADIVRRICEERLSAKPEVRS